MSNPVSFSHRAVALTETSSSAAVQPEHAQVPRLEPRLERQRHVGRSPHALALRLWNPRALPRRHRHGGASNPVLGVPETSPRPTHTYFMRMQMSMESTSNGAIRLKIVTEESVAYDSDFVGSEKSAV